MRNKAGSPVREDDFLERPADIQELWHYAVRGNGVMLAPRRMGKTSLLCRMIDLPVEGWSCLFLDVESLHSEAQFVARLLTTIFEAHPDGAWLEGFSLNGKRLLAAVKKAGPFEFHLAEALKEDWRDVGDTVLRLLGGLRGNTLILVDEFPLFVQNLLGKAGDPEGKRRTELFLQWFRDVRNAAHDGDFQIHFLLTGSIGLAGVVEAAGLSGTINDLYSFRLGPLSRELARELLRRLSEGEGLPFPEEVFEAILDKIGWLVPYHLQLLFREILRSVRFRGRPLDTALVETAYQALLSAENKTYFHHWVERLKDFPVHERDLAKALLSAAARAAKGISQSTILQICRRNAPGVSAKAVLSRLEHDGYLTLHEGRWRFTSALLRDWWDKWQVKKD